MQSGELSRYLPARIKITEAPLEPKPSESRSHEKVKELLHQPGAFTLRHGAHGELEIARSPQVESSPIWTKAADAALKEEHIIIETTPRAKETKPNEKGASSGDDLLSHHK